VGKKIYELSDNKRPSLEGFPNNACLLFAHAQTLTAKQPLTYYHHALAGMPEITDHTN
jgi:hypothetical protein